MAALDRHAIAAAGVRVLLADFDGSARRAVADVIDDLDGVSLTGQVGSRSEVAAALRRSHAEVLVIDDRLLPPEGHPLTAMGPLPTTVRVIVMGMDDTPGFAARAIRMGAEAWLAKDRAADELPELLRPS